MSYEPIINETYTDFSNNIEISLSKIRNWYKSNRRRSIRFTLEINANELQFSVAHRVLGMTKFNKESEIKTITADRAISFELDTVPTDIVRISVISTTATSLKILAYEI